MKNLSKLISGGHLGFLLALGTAATGQAQTIAANAEISGVAAGVGYDYTITLNNTGGSTSPIETFWFGWVPGEDFLPTSPTSVTPPTGWTDAITHMSAGDGYAIQYVTSTAPISPGSSQTFSFESADSPAAINGNSPFYPSTPVGTSFLYEGAPFSGASEQFVVQPAPEPSSVAIIMLGALGLMAVRWHKPVLAGFSRRDQEKPCALRTRGN